MIKVEIGYMTQEIWDALDWHKLRAILSYQDLPAEKPANKWGYDFGSFTITYREADELAALGLDIHIKPMGSNMLIKLQDRMRDYYGDITPADLNSGAAVQIHIPDFSLMTITEVDYIEDACTDEVQRRLDDGWKLLAVCPPNAQRRPDYIFGRSRKRT